MSLYTDKDIKRLKWATVGAKLFSTCAKRQFMALIYDKNGYMIGSGYNGSPPNYPHCNEGACPRLEEASASGSSYDNCISNHAETNAIIHSDWTLRSEGASLYVNGSPCFTCAKLIAGSGIDKVVCTKEESYSTWEKTLYFLKENNVKVIEIPRMELE